MAQSVRSICPNDQWIAVRSQPPSFRESRDYHAHWKPEIATFVKSFSTIIIRLCAIASVCAFGADKNGFEGTISATLTRAGTELTHFLRSRAKQPTAHREHDQQPEQNNIVDLVTKKLTIIYPHNTTFVHVDLAKTASQPGAAPIPPTFPTPPASNTPHPPSQGYGGTSSGAATVSPPPGPPLPQMPNNPGAVGPMMMPPMQSMPGRFGAPELKKTDKTKTIQGFDCTLYAITDRGENFEIWRRTIEFVPFRLIERDFLGRRFGLQMLEAAA
jgi:hypothetical protein